jgi:hypothetical protein
MSKPSHPLRTLLLAPLALAACLCTLGAGAANPNFPDGTGSVRQNAPDDPQFDRAEPDDADGGYVPGLSVFAEQFELFGFPPASTSSTATYKDPARLGQPQISGVSADYAWETSIGNSNVVIAILDTGIRWENTDLRKRVFLNCGELPAPELANGQQMKGSSPGCRDKNKAYDVNGDGSFDVDDYANDPRVHDANSNGILDAEDLILTFSDGVDHDRNGYVNDIAGWDFFDDDNDPFDASSYSSAHNHGTGRARDAAQETNDASGGAGVCPHCRIAPLRVWDTFVPDSDNWAQATAYAADMGFRVTENALGAIYNSPFARQAAAYAVARGVTIMSVSSDLDTASHNYPTNYDDMVYVAGIVPDVQPGLSPTPPPDLPYNNPLFTFAAELPIATYFRNSNVTQYGGHNHISMMADTGSFATGQASGAAGLIVSRGDTVASQIGGKLTPNEVKQILTMTAEDVLPENTIGIGVPDPSQPGWDQHFGYGRVNLRAGMAAVKVGPGGIPPQARILNPPWFSIVDPTTTHSVTLAGFLAANRPGAAPFTWTVQVGTGIEPLDAQFTTVASGTSATPISGTIASIPVAAIEGTFPPATDFTAAPLAAGPPIQGDAHVPSNQFMFTVRVRVRDAFGNLGEDRKSLFIHHDPSAHPGWPKFLDTGGEQATKLADINGDGKLELVDATSAGLLYVFNADGSPLASFNNGAPVATEYTKLSQSHPNARVFGSITPPHTALTTPAVGDLGGTGAHEIVAAAGDKVYAWEPNGALRPGFPVQINDSLSAPALQTNNNHLKTGIAAAPVLYDLDGDGRLEIVVAALDQRVYAWHADGTLVAGFPVLCQDPAMAAAGKGIGAEIVTTPAVGDINGDGKPEIVVGGNEIYPPVTAGADTSALMNALANPVGLPAELIGVPLEEAYAAAGKSSRIYAIYSDGFCHGRNPCDVAGQNLFTIPADAFLPGWPVALDGLAPDVLPLVGPGFSPALANLQNDPTRLDVVTGISTGPLVELRGDGTRLNTMVATPFGAASDSLDRGAAANLFEYPVVADINGDGVADVIKGGVSINALVNLVLPGQNLPFNHLILAWDSSTGQFLPSFPKATDDYMLLSEPSVADVGGGIPSIVIGNGLYLMHAYNMLGAEPSGWPKMLGGWISGSPAIGDMMGDGHVEVSAATREGYLFLFDTAGSSAGNSQWPSFHHDNRNTGNATVSPLR